MTTMGQTLREAQHLTNSIVTPKDTLVMGHWNVRSLYRGGTTAQVQREMEGYKLDIMGISECRWTGARRQRITRGQTLLYAGDETHSLTHARYVGWHVGQQQRYPTPVCSGPVSEQSPRCDGGS